MTTRLEELRTKFPEFKNYNDEELVKAAAPMFNGDVDRSAAYFGVESRPKSFVLQLAGDSKEGAAGMTFVVLAIAIAIGFFIRRMLLSWGKASGRPVGTGRQWLGWAIVMLCAQGLTHVAIKQDVLSILKFCIQFIVGGACAYVLGSFYGRFRKGWGKGSSSGLVVLGARSMDKERAPIDENGKVDHRNPIEEETSRANIAGSASDERRIYLKIAEELQSGNIDTALWTRLFAEADGDDARTKASYIRARYDTLSGERR